MERATEFTCHVCGLTKPLAPSGSITTGYGLDRGGRKICYECCAARDRESMLATGAAMLYLVKKDGAYRVTNWPGSLEFRTGPVREGRHNIAGKRYDVWFRGPDKKLWHGVQYGENTQICHCRRTKQVG